MFYPVFRYLCIRMEVTFSHGISWKYGRKSRQFQSRGAVKREFGPYIMYIRWYNSPNEHFEYSYASLNEYCIRHVVTANEASFCM